jgi:transposase
MSIITIGIDLAKNVFAVHGVDENGKATLIKPKVSREQLPALIVQLPPCLIGMEACSGAHHWARLFRAHGHTVRLMAPKFVSPYRMSGKRGKTDAADAAAICEAVTRPHMRFVPVKEEHQQIILCLHRTRNGFVEERTAIYNRLRGLISEFGIVLPQKIANLRREIGAYLEDLPGYANRCVGDLLTHADRLDGLVAEYDRAIAHAAREDARSKRLMQLPGIGPTTASALLASLGGGHDFANGRQVAAWIGLTPGQYSSGGVARLGRITKAGDRYLRSLLVMGARAILSGLGDKQDRFSRWARNLVERRGYWRAVVAIAAKNARLAWAVLKYGEGFRLTPDVA